MHLKCSRAGVVRRVDDMNAFLLPSVTRVTTLTNNILSYLESEKEHYVPQNNNKKREAPTAQHSGLWRFACSPGDKAIFFSELFQSVNTRWQRGERRHGNDRAFVRCRSFVFPRCSFNVFGARRLQIARQRCHDSRCNSSLAFRSADVRQGRRKKTLTDILRFRGLMLRCMNCAWIWNVMR